MYEDHLMFIRDYCEKSITTKKVLWGDTTIGQVEMSDTKWPGGDLMKEVEIVLDLSAINQLNLDLHDLKQELESRFIADEDINTSAYDCDAKFYWRKHYWHEELNTLICRQHGVLNI
jgi:hypothetical protein